MKSPIDIISEKLHKQVSEMAKKYLLTLNKYGVIKRARRHSQSVIDSMKNFKGVNSVKRTRLPRKLKKKNKKQGIVNIDINYTVARPMCYIEFKSVLSK